MKCRLCVLFLFVCSRSLSQTQTCPVNINFASGDLTHWYAYTGNNGNGNGPIAIKQIYDSNSNAPYGTRGAWFFPEYNLPSIRGMEVITYSTSDPFGGFSTVPNINGYQYKYTIKLGSTAITRGNSTSGGGGYIRGISYRIMVPSGPVTEPYTMTYAYAMVLENGTHISRQQPVISATLTTPSGVITCASPSYYLPTFNNTTQSGRGATLDSATAKKNGFKVSGILSPNANFDPNTGEARYLQDVWTKSWTEVTFDLSPYRGQSVTLNFEADNCIPGGHFAYAYIAIRNNCAGLMISGDSVVCNNSIITYSVPTLAGATYHWNIPGSWTLLSTDTSNMIRVRSSAAGGQVSIREKNSCADLTDTIQIEALPSPEAGNLDGSTAVCAGQNNTSLDLLNYSGVISKWLFSTNNVSWSVIPNNQPYYNATNLDSTTEYKVVVGKGDVCPPDTSSTATIVVDQKSVGGKLDPPEATLCAGQLTGETLILSGNTGNVQNWQYSTDGTNWTDWVPANTSSSFTVTGINIKTLYRVIDMNGVCPPDTSSLATIQYNPADYPQASSTPADTTICYGTTASLNARVNIGTSYTWIPVSPGNENIINLPEDILHDVSPATTTDYFLRIINAGCPNPLIAAFHVEVLPPVLVNAGRDTSVVVGEILQLHARSDDEGGDSFSWLPSTELSDPNIPDPVATYTASDNVIRYTVKATTAMGCTGEGFITVKVFKTKPDIFVPNAFTPGSATNAIFRPIPVGISSIDYFRVYNRQGQLVYSTSALGSGWDGSLNGIPQGSGGYVWMVKGTDYTGNIISKKGTMVLIR